MLSKTQVFEMAVAMAKEYCRGGGTGSPDTIFEHIHEKLVQVAKEAHIYAG